MKKDELSAADIALFLFGDPSSLDPAQPLEEQASLAPYDEEIEFSRDRLKLGQQIGSGAFGRVVSLQKYSGNYSKVADFLSLT